MDATCPNCTVDITGAIDTDVTPGASRRAPRAGDIVVCPACVSVLIIAESGRLLHLTLAQIRMLKPGILAAVQQARRRVVN